MRVRTKHAENMEMTKENKRSFRNLVLLGFLLLVCTSLVSLGLLRMLRDPDQHIDMKNRIDNRDLQPAAKTSLRFAVATMVSPKSTFVSYKRLVELIGREVGQDSTLVIRPSYREVREELQEGTVDVAIVCTGTYALLEPTGKVELLAQPVFVGTARYCCAIITAADSPAQSFKDLKGGSFAFTDPESCTGDFVPRCLLASSGIDVKSFFSKTIYTGSHDRSVTAVTNHVIDAAAVDLLVLEGMYPVESQLKSKVKIIWKSDVFGPPPIVVPSGLDPALKSSLQEVILNLQNDPVAKSLLRNIGVERFKRPDPTDYKAIIDLYRKGGMKAGDK
jgi:phosphonate transport system substrate-binding protein